MESNTKLYAVLGIVLLVAGSAVIGLVLLQATETGPSIEVIGIAKTEKFTLKNLKALPAVTRQGSFQNTFGNVRGQGIYRGVNVSALIDAVGGMTEDQWIRVTAADGYNQSYSYSNVYPDAERWSYQGDMVVAYEYNGTEVPAWDEGLRIMFLPEDGYYSNNDYENSTDEELLGGAAGPRCIQNVKTISIVPKPQYAVTLIVGEISESYTMNDLKSEPSVSDSAGYVKTGVTPPNPEGPYSYTGVPIYDLLDNNFELPDNYSVRATSEDGYTVYYTKEQAEGTLEAFDPETGASVGESNFTMVLAYEQNGGPLSDDGPLRVVFFCSEDYFSEGALWAKNVVELEVQQETISAKFHLESILALNRTDLTYYDTSCSSCVTTHLRTDLMKHTGVSRWAFVAAANSANGKVSRFNKTLVRHQDSILCGRWTD